MTLTELVALIDVPLIAANLFITLMLYNRQSLHDLRLSMIEERVTKLEEQNQ